MLTITYSSAGSATQTISIAETATAQQQTAAIQSALDAVAGHVGGNVSLSAGTFTLAGTGKASDGCLRVGSETEFHGAGMGGTILKLADGSTTVTGIVRTNSGQTLADGSVTTTSNVNIHDLTIDGNKANTTGSVDGFYCGPKPGTAQFDSNITLDHVEIMNVSRYGFDPHEQTHGLTISNSLAHGNGMDGFTIDFCQDVHLTNNQSYENGRHGFNIVTGSSDVTMIGNDAHDNLGSGIVVQTGDNEVRGWTHNVTISGGHIAHNGRDGITVKQSADVSVHDVAFEGNAGHGVWLAGVNGAHLDALVISNVPDAAEAIHLTNYVQDFNDADVLNNRYIATTGAFIAGTAVDVAGTQNGVAAWSWTVTTGDDSLTGSAGRDSIAADSGNDVVNGMSGDDTLYGNDGNDTLDGGAGSDKLYGGAGNDLLKGSDGFDQLDGGAGFDTVDYSSFGSAVTINLATTGVTGAGGAVAVLASIEGAIGSAFADTLVGDSRDNFLDGGAGNDTLNGGSGNDKIAGGLGNDVMTGGTGSDTFVFNTGWGADRITDFQHGRDVLDMTGIAGLTKFGDLSVTQVGADTQVFYATQWFTLQGVNASTINASDFLFHS